MTAFLIARLPSHPRSLGAVEFMQRNHFSFRISSNSSLLNLLTSLEGTEGGFAATLSLSDEFKLGDEEKQLIRQFVATEVKEEVDSDDEYQSKNTVDATEVKEEVESDIEQDDVRATEEQDTSGKEASISQQQSTLASQIQPPAVPSIVTDEEVQRGEAREMAADDLFEPADAGDSLMSIGPIHNDDSLAFDAPLDEDLLEQQTVQSMSSTESGVKEEKDISENVLKTSPVAVETVDPVEDPADVTMSLESIGEAEAEEADDEEMEDNEIVEEFEEQEAEENSTAGDDNVMNNDEECDDAQEGIMKKKKKGQPSGRLVERLLFACLAKNCPSSYKTFKELEEHMEIHSEKEEFFCDVCKKKFSSKDDAMAHIQERMKNICCGCGKECQGIRQLVADFRTHTGEKPFVCHTCGKGFSLLCNVKTHMMTHTGEKRFSCSFCKKGFVSKGDLKRHERTHTGDKPYKCTCCDFRCTTSSHLKVHERIHTGDKPYSCKFCEKRFSQKNNLKAHELTHTGVKPFECSHCGKRFARRSDLNKHIRIHTGERPFSCKECDKKFNQCGVLKRHMKTQHQL